MVCSAMEAGLVLSSRPHLFTAAHLKNQGRRALHNLDFFRSTSTKPCVSLKATSECSRRHFSTPKVPFLSYRKKGLTILSCDQFVNDHMNVKAASAESLNFELSMPMLNEDKTVHTSHDFNEDKSLHQQRPKAFRNIFLNLVRVGSVIDDAAESFFKSEIRRRLFVTAVMILISRVGYFIPLPGFDRRLIPRDYLGFASGSIDEFGDNSQELKLSLFSLGISPQIGASILMQILCHILPSLIKLRKEGIGAQEKIKSYIWWIALGFSIFEALVLSFYSLPYSIYAASQRSKHVMVTTLLLVCGALTMTWISDKITEHGFGQGSSLIICVGILTGYTDTLYKMLKELSGSAVSWLPFILAVIGVFTLVTIWAVVVTEGCRKIQLRYYGSRLASANRENSPDTEVEHYIPFNINPAGMQPILATSYLFAFPTIVARIFGSQFWEHVSDVLNPETSRGAAPWVFYTLYAFFVFLFNIFDIANMPKEIADYLNKISARIPNIKPGRATIEYLKKIQASTRFWGGVLLSILATTSTILDHYLRQLNNGFSVGFTSVLIIVGSIIELRRSYQAYNVMPSLSKALKRYGV